MQIGEKPWAAIPQKASFFLSCFLSLSLYIYRYIHIYIRLHVGAMRMYVHIEIYILYTHIDTYICENVCVYSCFREAGPLILIP